MDAGFDIYVYVDDNGEIIEHQLGGGNTASLSFDEAKNVAGSLFVGGYIHRESNVEINPSITLYGPMQIKKIRLVPRKVLV